MRLRSIFRGKALYIIPMLALLAALGVLIYAIAIPRAGEGFTASYLLGPGGQALDYPQKLAIGEQAQVTIGIINQEQEVATYRVVVVTDGAEIGELGPIVLGHNDKFEQTMGFTTARVGEAQKAEFLLYKQGQAGVYKSLYLWFDVAG